MASLLLLATLATALVYGWGGVEAAHGVLQVGTLVALKAMMVTIPMAGFGLAVVGFAWLTSSLWRKSGTFPLLISPGSTASSETERRRSPTSTPPWPNGPRGSCSSKWTAPGTASERIRALPPSSDGSTFLETGPQAVLSLIRLVQQRRGSIRVSLAR